MIRPTTSNWVQPERADLLMVLSAGVLKACDGNVSADSQPDDPVDPNGDTPIRSKLMLDQMVSNVRAAVRNAGHTPLSVAPGAIPPEAFDFVLYMAAWRLINSTPNIQMVVMTEMGGISPFGRLAAQADKWVNDIPKHAITPPTDPTGRDWTTSVTWPPDADLYTQWELDALEYTWENFSAMGYTRAEWEAMTNPPILGTVRGGSTLLAQDLSLQTTADVSDDREALGAL